MKPLPEFSGGYSSVSNQDRVQRSRWKQWKEIDDQSCQLNYTHLCCTPIPSLEGHFCNIRFTILISTVSCKDPNKNVYLNTNNFKYQPIKMHYFKRLFN